MPITHCRKRIGSRSAPRTLIGFWIRSNSKPPGIRSGCNQRSALRHFIADEFPKEPARQKSQSEANDRFQGERKGGITMKEPRNGPNDRAENAKRQRRAIDHYSHQAFFMLRFFRHPAYT